MKVQYWIVERFGKLDVENYLFDIEAGIKVNQYIEMLRRFRATMKTKFEKLSNSTTIHASGKELKGRVCSFEEIKNMNHWFKGKFLIQTMKLSERLYFFWRKSLNKLER